MPTVEPKRTRRRAVLQWLAAAIVVIAAVAGLLAALIYTSPRCAPGSGGYYIGGALLIAGCPAEDKRP